MAELAPTTVDKFNLIHLGALQLGLHEEITERSYGRLVGTFEPWKQSEDGVSHLDILDTAKGRSFHFQFAPLDDNGSPMEVIEFDDEVFGAEQHLVLGALSVCSADAIDFKVDGSDYRIDPFMVTLTEGSTILSVVGQETQVDPFMGDYCDTNYRRRMQLSVMQARLLVCLR